MKKTRHDLIALSQAITTQSARDSDAPDDPPEMRFNAFYPYEIDKALTKGDFAPLLKLLEAEQPIHPLLLPALADALKMHGRGDPGSKKKWSEHERKWMADSVEMAQRGTLAAPGFLALKPPMGRDAAINEYVTKSQLRGQPVSKSTVKRAIKVHGKKQ